MIVLNLVFKASTIRGIVAGRVHGTEAPLSSPRSRGNTVFRNPRQRRLLAGTFRRRIRALVTARRRKGRKKRKKNLRRREGVSEGQKLRELCELSELAE